MLIETRPGDPCARCVHTRAEHPQPDHRFMWHPDSRLVRRAEAAALEHPSVALRAAEARHTRLRRAHKAAGGGQWGVGPSDHGSCQRAVWYRETPPADYEPLPDNKDAAEVGRMLHEEYTRARRRRYPWRKFKVPVMVPGLDQPGECDEWDPLIGRVTDYKTCSDNEWKTLGAYGPRENHWLQVLDYGLGLSDAPLGYEEAGPFGVREVELLFIKRSSGECESFRRPWSKKAALNSVAELHAMLDGLDAGRVLPRVRRGRPVLGPSVDVLCAKYCPAVLHCWGLDKVPADRSPEGFALIHDDPDVEAALAEYDAAREDAKEPNARKEYAATLLHGLAAGRYGGFMLGWSGGNELDPTPDHEARVGQLAKLVPAGTELPPYPWRSRRSTVRIQVSRVRLAVKDAEKGEPK